MLNMRGSQVSRKVAKSGIDHLPQTLAICSVVYVRLKLSAVVPQPLLSLADTP
jgi:hypothetical protein